DGIMLCRHLLDKYLADVREAAPAEIVDGSAIADNLKLAEDTILVCDQWIASITTQVTTTTHVATTAQADEQQVQAQTAQVPTAPVAHVPLVRSGPVRGYVMPGHGGRRNAAGSRAPGAAAAAPRRVARSGTPLPMVQVKMDGQRANVQNAAEIA